MIIKLKKTNMSHSVKIYNTCIGCVRIWKRIIKQCNNKSKKKSIIVEIKEISIKTSFNNSI